MTWLDYYLVVIVHVGAIPASLFPLLYSRSPWRSTPVGKALMVKGTAVALLFDVPIIGYWWDMPAYPYIYAAVVTLVVIGVTYQFLVLCWRQYAGRHEESSSGDF